MALRDLFHSKIKDSEGMKLELGLHYENLTYDDPKRSYKHLMNIIDRTIMRRREQSNLTQTQIGLRQMLEGKDLLAAPAKPTPPPPTGGKPNKSNGKPDDAAPVLPQSKAKAHAKGKGKPKKNTRSTSTDSKPDKSKKHIRCKFHFTDAGCRNGDKCPFSHSKKTPETPSRSRTPSPSGRSGNQICFTFRKTGSCSRENCPFKHEAAPATPAAKAEAKAEAKAKAKAEAKAKSEPGAAAKKAAKSKAKPAAPAIRMCRAWNPSALLFSCSCNNLSLAEAGAGSNVSGPEGRLSRVLHGSELHHRAEHAKKRFPDCVKSSSEEHLPVCRTANCKEINQTKP